MKISAGAIALILLSASACSNGPEGKFLNSDQAGLDPALVRDAGEPPSEVLDYWALDGTLESVGDEDGWLCPAQGPIGFSAAIAPSEVPQELELTLPDREPGFVLNRDSGPGCAQPHLLVMLATTGSDYTTGMTVWPQTTRFEDICGAGCEWGRGTVEEPIVNGQPARLQLGFDGHTDVWWFDASLAPLYAETFGLTRDEVLGLVAAITVDPSMRRATVNSSALGALDVVSNQASVGFWTNGLSRSAVYDIDGSDISVDTRYDPAFDPRARFAPYIWTAELVDVGVAPAVWVDNGAGYTFLDFITDDGTHVTISGRLTAGQAVVLAEQLD